MENRICILTLFVFLFLLSGESRAMVAMPDAWIRMMIGVNQKDWSLLRERVQADLHVPDRDWNKVSHHTGRIITAMTG